MDPDESSRAEIHRLIERLARRLGNSRVKWVTPDQLHVTVAFLGEVPDDRISGVVGVLAAAAAAMKPFTVEVGGLGAFPSDHAPRVLWAGVREGEEELVALERSIWSALTPLGLSRGDGRPYHAHLTLGRCRAPLDSDIWRDCVRMVRMASPCRWMTNSLRLYRSILMTTGPRYEVVQTCPCAAG